MKVVIVGGVACGAKTAARLARICPEAEITMLERGQDLSYSNCGFPFYIGGEVANASALTHMGFGAARDADYFEKYSFTHALTGHNAVRIDRAKKNVVVHLAATGEERLFPYDKLVLATGASPIVPNIPGASQTGGCLGNVFTLWTLQDALAIRGAIEKNNLKKAVVVGAGLVGIETAEMLRKRGLDVSLIDMLPLPLMALAGEEGGIRLSDYLGKKGILFYGGETVTALEGDSCVQKIITDKREIEADLVILSIGVRPNVGLAQDAGLEMGKKAIRVNEFMQTSDPDIYAGGDCVESRCIISGEFVWQPMGSAANRQGRVIADHIAGLNSRFSGVERTAIARVFDWTIGKTGLTMEEAVGTGFSPVQMLITAPDIPGFMPGSAPLFIRMIADKGTRRILGAQVSGPGKADKRLDVLATAIKGNLTIDDLADVDFAYAPPFSTALDAVTHASNALRNKCEGLVQSYSPVELHTKADNNENFIVLDVRTLAEIDLLGKLPYRYVHIPLGELEKRMDEIPRDREVVILCKVGGREWITYTHLKRSGYTKIAILEGGILAWPYERA